jgi:multidrug transporter EmrE-like cation transporter
MKLLLAMLPTIILVAYSQLVTKWRVEGVIERLPPDADRWVRLWNYLSDPYILSAYVAALSGSVAWMFVVERHDLSLAFPVYVGLTVATVAFAGIVLFGELLTWQRALSIALILAGVALGSRS